MSAPIITTRNWHPEAYDLVIDARAVRICRRSYYRGGKYAGAIG